MKKGRKGGKVRRMEEEEGGRLIRREEERGRSKMKVEVGIERRNGER